MLPYQPHLVLTHEISGLSLAITIAGKDGYKPFIVEGSNPVSDSFREKYQKQKVEIYKDYKQLEKSLWHGQTGDLCVVMLAAQLIHNRPEQIHVKQKELELLRLCKKIHIPTMCVVMFSHPCLFDNQEATLQEVLDEKLVDQELWLRPPEGKEAAQGSEERNLQLTDAIMRLLGKSFLHLAHISPLTPTRASIRSTI